MLIRLGGMLLIYKYKARPKGEAQGQSARCVAHVSDRISYRAFFAFTTRDRNATCHAPFDYVTGLTNWHEARGCTRATHFELFSGAEVGWLLTPAQYRWRAEAGPLSSHGLLLNLPQQIMRKEPPRSLTLG